LSHPLHVLIAGAGIGGLTAAIALLRNGHTVTLLERAPELSEAGAGLQLSPNATAIFEQLELIDRIRRIALMPDSLLVRRGSDGTELMHMQLGPVAEIRWRAPGFVVHRADLQAVLLEAVQKFANATLHTGTEVLGFAATAGGIQVGALQGTANVRYDGDLLIGADGLHSSVRGQLGLGENDQPVYSGRTAWRALLDGASAPAMALRFATNLWLGSQAHIVHYPLRDGDVVNIVAIVEDGWQGRGETEFWDQEGDPRQIKARFSRWHPSARELIGAVPSWRRWPLFDRNPVPRWSLDRVVLLGDAAHPVLPFLAQGACLAIEDAAVLADAISRNDSSIGPAIAEFEKRRIVRSSEIRIASRRQGSIYHMSGLPAMARDFVMGRTSQKQLQARMDWIYKYRV
jgi:salicylate hydroxylase